MKINMNHAMEYLNECGYNNVTESGLETVFDNTYEAKSDLRSWMCHHPNWNEDQQAIIFDSDFEAGINKTDLRNFSNWILENANIEPHSPEWTFLYDIRYIDFSLATQEFVDKVNEIFGLSVVAGTKVSKIIAKIGNKLKVNEIVEMRPIFRHGEQIEKNFGWNYQFAMVGDALNPVKISKYTVISILSMDYYTSSNGKNWGSCHGISKGRFGFNGEWCGGTGSYMNDRVTVVFYTVDKDCEYPSEMWRNPKDRRMLFHIAEDGNSFVFGRLYPDGRDGGETGLAAQFRQCMQKVISDCKDEINLWQMTKGTQINSEYTATKGVHYRDYLSYGDTGHCIRKGKYAGIISIGSDGICPCCGNVARVQDDIRCDGCIEDRYECANCGDYFDYEDSFEGVYCEDNDCYYCCGSCANNDGVHYCEDDHYGNGWHTENNCYRDSYDRSWYYGNPEVITEDGNYYSSFENAEEDGYRMDEDDCWYPENELYYDEYTERYFHETSEMVEVEGRYGTMYFANEYNAEQYGCIKVDGEWFAEDSDEIFYDDFEDEYFKFTPDILEIEWNNATYHFRNKHNAMEFGFVEIEEDEWYHETVLNTDSYTGELFLPNFSTLRTQWGIFKDEGNAKRFGLFEYEGEWYEIWAA